MILTIYATLFSFALSIYFNNQNNSIANDQKITKRKWDKEIISIYSPIFLRKKEGHKGNPFRLYPWMVIGLDSDYDKNEDQDLLRIKILSMLLKSTSDFNDVYVDENYLKIASTAIIKNEGYFSKSNLENYEIFKKMIFLPIGKSGYRIFDLISFDFNNNNYFLFTMPTELLVSIFGSEISNAIIEFEEDNFIATEDYLNKWARFMNDLDYKHNLKISNICKKLKIPDSPNS